MQRGERHAAMRPAGVLDEGAVRRTHVGLADERHLPPAEAHGFPEDAAAEEREAPERVVAAAAVLPAVGPCVVARGVDGRRGREARPGEGAERLGIRETSPPPLVSPAKIGKAGRAASIAPISRAMRPSSAAQSCGAVGRQ
ncbi:MAG: hypothetical protein N2Z67_09735 [Acetobacteraceae bacterium]|nr:hypothetical protein [Acetobacteraceae bacterium]